MTDITANIDSKAIHAIAGNSWAITETALQQIIMVADRANREPGVLELVERRRLERTETAKVTESGIAIIPIEGPIFPKANLFTAISGATSAELVARDFNSALNNPKVKAILLLHDSPGGAVNGISSLSKLVFDSRGNKPIVSYVTGMSASGAYWIGSSADEIISADTAMVGSIGVVMAANIRKDPNTVEIVSSNAPLKRADLSTSEGRDSIQTLVDKLENVFIDAVARNRNIDGATVVSTYGRGGLMVASDALLSGMIDKVMTFEDSLLYIEDNLINDKGNLIMSSKSENYNFESISADDIRIHAPTIYDEIVKQANTNFENSSFVSEVRKEAYKVERERIKAVYDQGKGIANDELLEAMMFDGETTGPEAAVKILKVERENKEKALTNFRNNNNAAVATTHTNDVGRELNPSQASGELTPENSDLPLDQIAQSNWDASSDVRKEFNNNFKSYLAYMKAKDDGRVRIFNKVANQ